MNSTTRKLALSAALLLLPASSVLAVPVLQLYVEGAEYNTEHESWVFDAALSEPARLWVIGNVDGDGGHGPIEGVHLSVVYPDPIVGDGGTFDVSLTSVTTGGFSGFVDPSVPQAPLFTQLSEDGDTPTLSDGSELPEHGTYGPGFEWQEFALGDFTLTDSPIADFIDSFPDAPAVTEGQINAYDVTVSVADGAGDFDATDFDIHFDAYNSVMAGNHSRATFAPFSHDAGTGINEPVPEPGVAGLVGAGLVAFGLARRRRRARG